MGFDPSVIHPQAGDSIVFEFRSGVHSAVQSSFDNPCVSNGGFNSGVFTVSDDLAVDAPGLPISRVLVNGTEIPVVSIPFFDEAGGLCYRGAVLAVNPTAAQSEVVFKENAALPPKPATTTSPAASSTSGATATGTPTANSDNVSSGNNSNSSPGTVNTAWAAVMGALFGGLAVMA
ncbi:hypothetical protein FA13DRAFT_1746243 [Coprinellus micaceus]|uniref:Cupredoxin n=1 Tax=Coprinellus micaceus TaxID=71717 RepID=A0A4Y7SBS8_COPMI|nr:hypothetical protein FA13DRAFT_1746243 [Coprinellus micaceus]